MKFSQSIVLERLQQALNAHDLAALLVCFAPDFQGDQPLHPDRAFQGPEQVLKNWSVIFQDVPDFHAEVLRSAVLWEPSGLSGTILVLVAMVCRLICAG